VPDSTILRQIRKVETRSDDLLDDAVLHRLGTHYFDTSQEWSVSLSKETIDMSFDTKITTDETILEQEEMRILWRLCEKGAVLAVATDMDKAVVVRDGGQRPEQSKSGG
jgi:copper chaperone CopZ